MLECKNKKIKLIFDYKYSQTHKCFLNCSMKIKYILVAQVSNVKHTHNVAIKKLCEPFVNEIFTMCS
jgi:hypothetical protein